MRSNRRRRDAFTLIELVIVILMCGLLFGLLLPSLSKAKQKSQRIGCVNNLKSVGLGFRIWAAGNSNLFPMQRIVPKTLPSDSSNAARQRDVLESFRALSNELGTPRILACPADDRVPAASFASLQTRQVSYFLGLDADGFRPGALLAGDRNLTLNGAPMPSGVVVLTTNTTVGWTGEIHRFRGNVALADGSVQQVAQAGLGALLRASGAATNRIIVP